MSILSKKNTPSVPRLPDSELEVMQIIWECEAPAARKDVEARMQEIHPVAQTTLLTLLSRLADKGFLKVEKIGRSSAYTPLISRESYLADQGNRFINKLCNGSMSALACALSDGGLTDEDIEELKELLDKRQI